MSIEAISNSAVNIHAITDLGMSRTHNEDNFIVCPDLREKRWYLSEQPNNLSEKGCLLVVADGMGGANAGEVASEIAVETIKENFNSFEISDSIDEAQVKDFLTQVILKAHEAILATAQESIEYKGMGTTILILWAFPGKAIIGWCGDSRAYLYKNKIGLKILTKDHSLVWELVEAGKISPEEADIHPDNNIITQSLGDERNLPHPDFITCKLEDSDKILLCSDGLNNLVTLKEMEEILREDISLNETNKKLVGAANSRGGTDNITVLTLEVIKKRSKNKVGVMFWMLVFLVIVGLLCYTYFNRQAFFSSNLTYFDHINLVKKGSEDLLFAIDSISIYL